jgi:membrane protease YdiL (CAAX protease family)
MRIPSLPDCNETLTVPPGFFYESTVEKWTPRTALRDLTEIVAVLAFVVLIPPLVERFMVSAGLRVVGTNRIVATGLIFIAWTVFAGLLVRINGERLSDVGLNRPVSVGRTILYGVLVAAVVFMLVVSLERLGYGANRLGDMAAELKSNPALLAERVTISVLVVGPVEEFIFRGFLFLRLTKLFGGSTAAIAAALVLQAGVFGLSHAYQHLYGILLTTFLGIFFSLVYMALRRNLWIVLIGHGVYDAAHAIYLSDLFGNRL